MYTTASLYPSYPPGHVSVCYHLPTSLYSLHILFLWCQFFLTDWFDYWLLIIASSIHLFIVTVITNQYTGWRILDFYNEYGMICVADSILFWHLTSMSGFLYMHTLSSVWGLYMLCHITLQHKLYNDSFSCYNVSLYCRCMLWWTILMVYAVLIFSNQIG